MKNKINHWYCDVCGEKVTIDNGYVVWNPHGHDALNDGDIGFKIIHQGKCDLGTENASLALDFFVNEDGLARLTSLLSYGEFNRLDESEEPKIGNIREFIDFFRRLQIPNYEEARRNFKNQDVIEMMYGANEIFPYTQEVLNEVKNKK